MTRSLRVVIAALVGTAILVGMAAALVALVADDEDVEGAGTPNAPTTEARPDSFAAMRALGYPAVVALGSRGAGATCSCTGALIGPSTVLTAAHCLNSEGDRLRRPDVLFGASCADARAGANDAFEVSTTEAHVHPGFDPELVGTTDVGVLRLSRPVTDIAPLPMARTARYEVGDRVTHVGFGRTEARNAESAGRKRVFDTAIRVATEQNPVVLSAAGGYEAADDTIQLQTCHGDSGGPGLAEVDGVVVIIGVVDTGPADCVATSSTIYPDARGLDLVGAWDTRIDQVRDWIVETANTWEDPDIS